MMVSETPNGGSESEYVPVDLRSLFADRAPLVDLYCTAGGQYVLYCKAQSTLTRKALRRLFENGVTHLYMQIVNGVVDTGDLDLAGLLSLPDSQMSPAVKADLLYSSAAATVRCVLLAPEDPRTLTMARTFVGATVAHLTRETSSFLSLVRLMRHDFSVYTHSLNVCSYAMAIGSAFGLDDSTQLPLGLGALLHDLGKSRIPRTVLDKPAPLTADEWVIMRRHPEWGVELAGAIAGTDLTTSTIILQHHERIDGSGYPRGIPGDQTHRLAKLVAVADVYDALTGPRPYRKAVAPSEALRVISDEMAGKLDREATTVLARLLPSGRRRSQAGRDPGDGRAAGECDYHIAGHLVAASLQGLIEDTVAHARKWRDSEHELLASLGTPGRGTGDIEARIVAILAGPAAEDRAVGYWCGGSEREAKDLAGARSIASGVVTPAETDSYLAGAARRASDLVEEHWPEVEAMASDLRSCYEQRAAESGQTLQNSAL